MIHAQALTEYQRQLQHYAEVKRRLWGKAPAARIARPINDNVVVEAPKEEPRKFSRWDHSDRKFDWHVVSWIVHKVGYFVEQHDPERVPFDEICYSVLAHFPGVSLADLRGTRRTKEYIVPRHICWWLIRRMRNDEYASLPSIGRWFGGKDHSTIVHGIKKIDAMIERGELEWLRKLAN